MNLYYHKRLLFSNKKRKIFLFQKLLCFSIIKFIKHTGEEMNLREYLFKNNISYKQFSETLDYSYSYVTLIINEERQPSRKLIRMIEKATNNEVKYPEI